jgi:hypothetical protein
MFRQNAGIYNFRSVKSYIQYLYLGGDVQADSDAGTLVTATGAELNLNDGVVADVDFTIGAEAANVINVALQLNDANGAAVAEAMNVQVFLSDNATGLDVTGTAPDGGIAIGTDGDIIGSLTANIALMLQSEADGDIDIDITESGTDTWYLVVVLPSGKHVVSGAITFA